MHSESISIFLKDLFFHSMGPLLLLSENYPPYFKVYFGVFREAAGVWAPDPC